MYRPLLPAIIVLVSATAAAHADDDHWTISCSRQGQVVHLEQVTSEASRVEQETLMTRYPGATCVFLADAPAAAVIAAPVGSDLTSLDQALRAISGGKAPPLVTEPSLAFSPPPLDAGLAPPAPPAVVTPRAATPVALAANQVVLATYRDTAAADVIADWKHLLQIEPTFRALTPTVDHLDGGLIQLNAEPVHAETLGAICVAAESSGMDCTPSPVITASTTPAEAAAAYLTYLYPLEILPIGNDQQDKAVLPILFDGQQDQQGRSTSLTCYRTVFEPQSRYPLPPFTSASPPLPRPRPVKGATAANSH